MIGLLFAGFGAAFWLLVLALPWQPWRIRERLEAGPEDPDAELSDVTVLLPARNEAAVLPHTLPALIRQGRGLRVVLADDQSTDATADIAHAWLRGQDHIVRVPAPPAGWSGKLWA